MVLEPLPSVDAKTEERQVVSLLADPNQTSTPADRGSTVAE